MGPGPHTSHCGGGRGRQEGKLLTLGEKENAEEMPDSAQGTGDWRESTQQGGWPFAIDSVPQCPKLTRDNGSNSARHSVCPLGGEDSIPAAGDGGKGAGMMSSLLFLA